MVSEEAHQAVERPGLHRTSIFQNRTVFGVIPRKNLGIDPKTGRDRQIFCLSRRFPALHIL
jgi:hypothetical protein